MYLRNTRGIGLIELLVALAISSLVLLAVVQLFAQTKVSYVANESIVRLQENGRFAMQLLARDVRSADYWGCLPRVGGNASLNISPLIADLVDSGGNPVTDYNNGISGTDGGTAGGPAGSSQAPDSLRLVSAQSATVYPVAAGQVEGTSAIPITVTGDSEIQAGDLVMVGECTHAQILQVTNEPDPTPIPASEHIITLQHSTSGPPGNPNPNNATGLLEYTFTNNAMVYPKVRNITYSIDDGTGTLSGLPALLRNGEEIVSGVENLQVQFGLDTNSDRIVDQYVSANNVTDFENVISIRITLLVRSAEARANNAASYMLADENVSSASIAPEANGLYPSRRVYTQTIAFRNRTM